MKKLLKYDFLDNYVSILLVNALVFFSVIGASFFSKFNFYDKASLLLFAVIFYSILFISFLLWIVLIVLAILNSINKKLFSPQGYLTFSLPVSVDAILTSRILINLFWIAISILLFYVAICIGSIINQDMQNLFAQMYRVIFPSPLGTFLMFLKLFSTFALVLVEFLFILSLLNIGKIKKFRLVVGVFIYLGLEILIGGIKTMFLVLLPNAYSDYLHQMQCYGISALLTGQVNIQSYLLAIGMNIIEIGILYCITRYLIANKLELE